MKRVHIFILCLILIVAFAVRIYRITEVPPSPFLDEVSNGYNAYSLLKTGTDEYGRKFPLLLQAYNDFRPALFVYTIIPFIAVFGLNDFAIRLPTVLLTVATTVSLFLLTEKLFATQHQKKSSTIGTWIGLTTAFLYAISPWSIYSSRISDEINMSLSFFVFGLTSFLYAVGASKEVKRTVLYFITSIVLFMISFYAYHGIKLFLPFFICTLFFLYFSFFIERKKIVFSGMLIALFLLIPLFIAFTAPGATVRLGAVSANKDPQLIAYSAEKLLYDEKEGAVLGKLFDNRRVIMANEFIKNSLRNVDISWLFVPRESKTFRVVDFSPNYLFGLPLLLLGTYWVIRNNTIDNRGKLLLFFWITLSVLPSGLSSESPHLNRANTMLPGLIILQGIGLYSVLSRIYGFKNIYAKIVSFLCVIIVIGISFLWFLHAYFVTSPYYLAKVYSDGLIPALQFAKANEHQYKKIVVSNGGNTLMSYMYYLYGTKLDPALYQKMGGTKSAFFTDEHFIGKYAFVSIGSYYDKLANKASNEKTLFIVNSGETSAKINDEFELVKIKEYYYPNGKESILVYEGKIEAASE